MHQYLHRIIVEIPGSGLLDVTGRIRRWIGALAIGTGAC
jgi:hypothetical protein